MDNFGDTSVIAPPFFKTIIPCYSLRLLGFMLQTSLRESDRTTRSPFPLITAIAPSFFNPIHIQQLWCDRPSCIFNPIAHFLFNPNDRPSHLSDSRSSNFSLKRDRTLKTCERWVSYLNPIYAIGDRTTVKGVGESDRALPP